MKEFFRQSEVIAQNQNLEKVVKKRQVLSEHETFVRAALDRYNIPNLAEVTYKVSGDDREYIQRFCLDEYFPPLKLFGESYDPVKSTAKTKYLELVEFLIEKNVITQEKDFRPSFWLNLLRNYNGCFDGTDMRGVITMLEAAIVQLNEPKNITDSE
jgi:hypothetical protein